MTSGECLFCSIADKTIPAHVVWEDDKNIAFLTIFPNTEGATVVAAKDHHGSYFATAPLDVVQTLVGAAAKVACIIDQAYEDVGRTGMIFEGLGVNHLHALLVPMHGTAAVDWASRTAPSSAYFDHYPGYISSNDGQQAPDDELKAIADKIRSSSNS